MTDLTITPHIIHFKNNTHLPAQWGYLQIPENHAQPDENNLTLPFVRFQSTHSTKPPIFFLQGGPGISILDSLPYLEPFIRASLTLGDIIFIDHRGSGLARPTLAPPTPRTLPFDQPLTHHQLTQANATHIQTAIDYWQTLGHHLPAYHAHNMAHDINTLRQILNYDQIRLVGGSFGSHHAFALIRAFPHTITQAFLWGIEGPNHTFKRPLQVDTALQKLNHYLTQHPTLGPQIPNIAHLIQHILNHLQLNPVTLPLPNQPDQTITLGPYDLAKTITDSLGNIRFLAQLPARLLQMQNNDFSWLAATAAHIRAPHYHNLMPTLTDLASGATTDRWHQIETETLTALLGNAINDTLPELRHQFTLHDLGDQFRAPLTTDIPITLVSGDLDPRTPLQNAQDMLPHFTNAHHLIIEGATHNLFYTGSHRHQLRQRYLQFFNDQTIDTTPLRNQLEFATMDDLS
ncbi:MAG TPA: alpha/beta fold hydrolase [Anaerolineae bacterium]|nr:alpha/beta fold hydrolase [Anaerolineae bacterium]